MLGVEINCEVQRGRQLQAGEPDPFRRISLILPLLPRWWPLLACFSVP